MSKCFEYTGLCDLKKGDMIICDDKDDAIETMKALLNEGIDTDFAYECDGEKVIWLEVINNEYIQ